MVDTDPSILSPSKPGRAAPRAAEAKSALGKRPGPKDPASPDGTIGRALIAGLTAAFVIGVAWSYSVLFGGFNYAAVGTVEAQITGAINLAFSSQDTYSQGNLVPVVRAYSQLRPRDFTPDGKAIYSPFRTRITVTGSGKATYTVEWHSLPVGACSYLLNSFHGPSGLRPAAITVNDAAVSRSLTAEVVGKACSRLTGNDIRLVF